MITNNNTTTKGNTKAGIGLLLSWLDGSFGAESPFETIGKITTEVLSDCVGSSVAEIVVIFSGSEVSEGDAWVASAVIVDVAGTGEIKTGVDVDIPTEVCVLIG
jgi:hypothetical protein